MDEFLTWVARSVKRVSCWISVPALPAGDYHDMDDTRHRGGRGRCCVACGLPSGVTIGFRGSVKLKKDFPYSAEDGIFQHMKIVEYSPKIGRMQNIPVKYGILL